MWEKVGLDYFWGDLFDSRFYIAKMISQNEKENVIDIGCGAGVMLYFSNAPLKIGIDHSIEALKDAKKIGQNNFELIQADTRFLPIKDSFAKNILAMHIISALEEKDERLKIMKEINRISAKNSELLITGANRLSKYFKKTYTVEYNKKYAHYSEIMEFFQDDFSIEIVGYGPFSKYFMYPLKLVYKIPEKILELFNIEDMIHNLLKSKKYLKNGRSYVIISRRKS